MLGADMLVGQPIGFLRGMVQDPLDLVAERELHGGGDLVAHNRAPFDLLADALDRIDRFRKKPIGEVLVLTNQAEQEMLGFDKRAAKLAGLVTGEKNHPLGFLRVFLKHKIAQPVPHQLKSSPALHLHPNSSRCRTH